MKNYHCILHFQEIKIIKCNPSINSKIVYHQINIFLYFCSYVQHILEKNEEELLKLLSSKECYIFIAGNAKDMPTAVKNVFINILTKHKHLNTIDMMETKGFYQTETWS